MKQNQISRKMRGAILSLLIGVVLIIAPVIPQNTITETTNDTEKSEPTQAGEGFFSNGDLMAYRDWSSCGCDGRSWSNAYYIGDIDSTTGSFYFWGTTKYVVVANSSFDTLIVYGAKHIIFQNCTFGSVVRIRFSRDITINNSVFSTTMMDLTRSRDVWVEGSLMDRVVVDIMGERDTAIRGNTMLGDFHFYTDACSLNISLYLNDMTALGQMPVIRDPAHILFTEYNGVGNGLSLRLIRRAKSDLTFHDFTRADEEQLELLRQWRINTTNLYILSQPLEYDSMAPLSGVWCVISLHTPNISAYLSPSPPVPPDIYSVEGPSITYTVDDMFYVDSIKLLMDGLPYNATAWNQTAQGDHVLMLLVQDVFGGVFNYSFNVRKDTEPPIIESAKPIFGTFGASGPNISAVIYDISGISRAEISFDGEDYGEVAVYPADSDMYYLDIADLWGELSDGNHSISLRAYDMFDRASSVFNIGNFTKDTTAPRINFTTENSRVFGPHDDYCSFSFTIDDLSETYQYLAINGIHVADIAANRTGNLFDYYHEWTHGDNTVGIYAEDIAGNMAHVNRIIEFDLRYDYLFLNYTDDKIINHAPTFTALYGDPRHESARYYINSSCGVLYGDALNGTNTMSDGLFSQLSDGEYSLTICVNDSLGNTAEREFIFIRDTTAPYITITSPLSNTMFSRSDSVPVITFNGSESHLATFYYSIEGVNNLTISFANDDFSENGTLEITFTIDPEVWREVSDRSRYVNITIYGVDAAGNVGQCSVILITDPVYYVSHNAQIMSALFVFLGILAVVIIVNSFRRYALNQSKRKHEEVQS